MNLKQILKLYNLPLLGTNRIWMDDNHREDWKFVSFDVLFSDANNNTVWIKDNGFLRNSKTNRSYREVNDLFEQIKNIAHTAVLYSAYESGDKMIYDNKVLFAKFKGEWYIKEVEIL